jgi:hypothetical protein
MMECPTSKMGMYGPQDVQVRQMYLFLTDASDELLDNAFLREQSNAGYQYGSYVREHHCRPATLRRSQDTVIPVPFMTAEPDSMKGLCVVSLATSSDSPVNEDSSAPTSDPCTCRVNVQQ